MASLSFALPGPERCERPSSAVSRISVVQPGRLAQGPDEKKGRAGRTTGWTFTVIKTFLPECSRRVGAAWPAAYVGFHRCAVNCDGAALLCVERMSVRAVSLLQFVKGTGHAGDRRRR